MLIYIVRNIQILEIRACLKFKLDRFFCRRDLIIEKPAVVTFVQKLAYFEKEPLFHFCPSTRVSIFVQNLAYS